MDLTSIMNNSTNFTAATAAANTASADKLKNSIRGVNSQTTREELEESAKSFEAYFVEQVMKQVKETNNMFSGEEDSTMSQLTDFYMDSTISDLSKQIVEDYGGSFTNSMVEQMARNYGIDLSAEETDASAAETAGASNASAAEAAQAPAASE